MRKLPLTIALLLCVATALAQTSALPTTQLTAGIHLITAEVAATDPTRVRGLMYRQALPANHGMLFVFEGKSIQCMWMKNTLIPLSVAYIADDGSIVNVEDMKPQTEDSHCAKRPVRFALEMNKGWFASKGVKPGAKLRGLEKYRPR